jgi:hypothetical protein
MSSGEKNLMFGTFTLINLMQQKTDKLMEEAVIGDLKQYMNFVTELI